MIFDLIQDFEALRTSLPLQHPAARRIDLSREALVRHAHFIARRPTTLFQCLWNECWWFDGSDAEHERGFAAASDGAPSEPPPNRRTCPHPEISRPSKDSMAAPPLGFSDRRKANAADSPLRTGSLEYAIKFVVYAAIG